jgi:16S rRNA C1402 N4-methylase RsmH
MKLEKRLQALEDSRHDTRGATLLIRTIQALRAEDSAELAALEVELATATSALASTARAMLAARP